MAEVLHRAVPDGLPEFAREHLFGPLEVPDAQWACDPSVVPSGPAHLRLPAGAVAKLGAMLLGDGLLDGRRLVSAQWVAEMRTETSPGGPPEGRAYGMGLWLEPDDCFFGAGWAGQLLWCRPRDGLVLVTLSDPGFDYGPPASDRMPSDWVAPLDLARRSLLNL